MQIYLELALHDDYKSACAMHHSYTANMQFEDENEHDSEM